MMRIPFQTPLQRIFAAWQKKDPASSVHLTLAGSRLRALQHNIKDALRFLRKRHLRSIFFRHKLPWYIVLGSSQTGKTSLLAYSGLELVSTNARPVEHIAPTQYCQWFFGKEAVFIDTSGSLMLPYPMDNTALYLWKKCIHLLYRYRHFHPLDGILLTLDIVDFQTQTFEQRRQYIDSVLHHLQAFSDTVPVYIFLTRCDRLHGFTEFFHLYTPDERDQVCGITLSTLTQQDFAPHLEAQYNRFLERLNQQILPYIQRERDIKKRAVIKNFPLQIEAQKRIITQLSTQLHSTKHPIQGIYFTSSQQEGIQTDALLPLLDTFGFPEQPNLSDRPLQKNAFFIKNTLQKIIHTQKNKNTVSNNIGGKLQNLSTLPRFYLYSSMLFVTLFILMLSSYFYNRQAVEKVHTILAEYQVQQQGNPLASPLSLIDTLTHAQNIVQYASNPFTGLIFHHASSLKTQLTELYRKALDTTFAPKLEQILEDTIRRDMQKKSPQLFNTLRLYLMMGNPIYREPDFIDSWFTKNMSAENAAPPLQHIHALLEKKSTYFHNTALIQSAREILRHFPLQNFIYLQLEEKYAPLSEETNILSKNTLYTPENFKNILERDIPAFTEQILKKDAWVLGETSSGTTEKRIAQLSKEVQQIYTARYITFWGNQLAQLSIPDFEDLQEAKSFAASLNTSDSALTASVNLIQKNLSPIAGTQEGQRIWGELTKIRALLEKNRNDPKTREAIQKFTAYLDTLLTAQDTDHAIFAATEKRMRAAINKDPITQLISAAKEMPAPISAWFTQLAIHTWQTMLHASENQLNIAWQSEVLPVYQSTIENRYPVFREATEEEISLPAFAAFFGPKGILDNFFAEKMAAFVDSSTLYWQWKKVDGVSMPIPQETLEMFNRAALIRKMYFANQEKMPSVLFSVTPSNLELISDNFLLQMGEQTVHYATDFKQTKQIAWPDKKSETALFAIQDTQGKKIYFEEKGPWAMFRLLGHARLIPTSNATSYQLEFDVGQQKVTYDLAAEHLINAFMPHILTAFRCPERL